MSSVATAGNQDAAQRGAMPERASVQAAQQRRRKPLLSMATALSLALHLALALLLLTHSFSRGVHQPHPRTVVVISLESLRDTGDPKAAHPDTPHPAPDPAAVPMPDARAVPKPKHAAAPPKPAQPVSAAQPKVQSPAAQPKPGELPTPAEKRGEEGESTGISLLNRVRTNWLRPASSSQSFRCRLRIDYLAGGFIANVAVLDGCGNNPLDDSVERAVWKTQPLPLSPAQSGPGSMVLEFTP